MTSFSIFIPTLNGGEKFFELARELQKLRSIDKDYDFGGILVVDSGSQDSTVELCEKYKFNLVKIDSSSFNHGGTRNIALNSEEDIVVFLTQDSIPESARRLVDILKKFQCEEVAAVCGRQIPHNDANPLASHARYFNYPSQSSMKSIDDVSELGIKTVFMSNSFAAYRVSALKAIGGFPSNTILCEDMYAVAKMLKSGYKVGYCAEAVVKHSHNYTPVEEFKRYFDIGVFHSMEPWIQQEFGGAGGEGLKYVKSELCYLWKRHKLWIPLALINNAAKIWGMKLGSNFNLLPLWLIRKCSMHHRFWQNGKPSVKSNG